MSEPIRMRCEGSTVPGHGLSHRIIFRDGVFMDYALVTMCAMCGQHVEVVDEDRRTTIEHERDDVLAMLDRGDYG